MQNYGSHKPFGSLADLVKSKKRAKRLCVGCGAGIQRPGRCKTLRRLQRGKIRRKYARRVETSSAEAKSSTSQAK